MELREYLVRRLALLFLVLFGVVTIMFFVSHVIPADPVAALLGSQAEQSIVDRVRHEWGFDKPMEQQYVDYISGIVRGDLGRSFRTARPVAVDLVKFMPATIELATFAIILAIALGLPLAIASAVKRDTIIDHVTRVFSLTGLSMPVFWTGLILLYVMYLMLGIFPGSGRLDISVTPPPEVTGLLTIDSLIALRFEAFWNALMHLVLPGFALAYFALAWITRMARASILEVMTQDYVRMARAKGLGERIVLARHILRNAMIPTTTVVGLSYGFLLEGSILTETIFSWPGMGLYAAGSFLNMDYMAVMGVALVAGAIFAAVNLVVDFTYALLDPRIRLG